MATSRPRLSRRDALKLLAAAGVTAGGGYALFEYPPWLNEAHGARKHVNDCPGG